MNPERRARHRKGLFAEMLAAFYLRCRGYRILAQRYKTPVGEIDIIARRGDVLAFVEVKLRRDIDDGAEAVTPRGQARIARAAGHYLARHQALASLDMRFDAILVSPPFILRHLDNAWRPLA